MPPTKIRLGMRVPNLGALEEAADAVEPVPSSAEPAFAIATPSGST